jgi:hypothetical protein
MRFPAALSAALAWLFLAALARAETPDSAAAAGDSAPASAPAPAPASGEAEAAASTPTPPAMQIVPAEPDEPVLEPIPSAHDTLSHHFVVGASLGAKWPFGSLADGLKQSEKLGAGVALNLDLGVGLSRNVVLGAWGELDDYSSSSACSCSTRSFAGGPFVRYHIVQGTRFDPWGAIAVGFRKTTLDDEGTSKHYFGPDWLRLVLGGDWYPFANMGIGPYLEFDVGAYNRHPHSSSVDTALHTGLGTGLRLTLDFPGK